MACPSQLILIMLSVCIINSVNAEGCKQLLRQIGDHQATFLRHFVDKSNSSESCTYSGPSYKEMVDTYNVVTSNCSDTINRNRLLVVPTLQKNLVDLWNKGFCDDCSNNDTETFKVLKTNFDSCLESTKEPCVVCQHQYLDLNNQYKQMEQDKNGKVCFDTQDAMNRTRSKWSKDLKCCRREFTFTLFFVGSSIIGIIPFVFYVAMYAYTKRRESNHEILYPTFEPENQAPVASTSSGVTSGALVGQETPLAENTNTPPAVNVTETEEEADVPILGSPSNSQNEQGNLIVI